MNLDHSSRDSCDRRRSASKRTHWLLAKLHVRLSQSTVCLSRIAVDASQYAIRPGRLSTLSTRDNVVNRELFAARLLSTVLATHLVTLEYVSAAEGNLLRRHCIELGQCNDFRYGCAGVPTG